MSKDKKLKLKLKAIGWTLEDYEKYLSSYGSYAVPHFYEQKQRFYVIVEHAYFSNSEFVFKKCGNRNIAEKHKKRAEFHFKRKRGRYGNARIEMHMEYC